MRWRPGRATTARSWRSSKLLAFVRNSRLEWDRSFMRALSIIFSLAMMLAASARGENWPQWRGPHFNGSSTEKNLPSEFSKTKNVKWSTPLPGPSAATPIIWEDRVFISSGNDKAKTLHAMCLDRKSGKVLWNHQVGAGYNFDEKSNFASPSPVTD